MAVVLVGVGFRHSAQPMAVPVELSGAPPAGSTTTYRYPKDGVVVTLPAGWEHASHAPFGLDSFLIDPRFSELPRSPRGSVLINIASFGGDAPNSLAHLDALARRDQGDAPPAKGETVSGHPAIEERLNLSGRPFFLPDRFPVRRVAVQHPNGTDFVTLDLFYLASSSPDNVALDRAFDFILAHMTVGG